MDDRRGVRAGLRENAGCVTGVGGVSRVACRLGAWATIPAGPMTADPTPVVISVAGLAVARKTLPARRDEAAVLPAPKSGCSQALLITPPDSKGRPVSHEARRAGRDCPVM